MTQTRRNLIKSIAILGAGFSVPLMANNVDSLPVRGITKARDRYYLQHCILNRVHESVFSEELLLQSGLSMDNFVLDHIDGLGKFYRWKGTLFIDIKQWERDIVNGISKSMGVPRRLLS